VGGPNYLIFFVTAKCNLRCPHCFYLDEIENANPGQELQLEEISIIAQNAPLLYHVTLTGGETFIRKDIDEIATLFYKYSHTRSFTITTNGMLSDRVKEKVEQIAINCPNAIIRIPLSIDGIGDIQDKVRGKKGVWDQTMKTYHNLRDLSDRYDNIKIDVTSVLSRINESSIHDLVDYVKNNMKVDNHCILLARGAIRDKGDVVAKKEIFEELADKTIHRRRGKYKFPIFSRIWVYMREATEAANIEIQKRKRMPFTCQAGRRLIEMSEYGEIFPCEILDSLIEEGNTLKAPLFNKSYMGNVRDFDYDVNKVLKTKKAFKVLEFVKNNGCFCTFECAIGASLIFEPKNFWRLIFRRACFKRKRYAKLT
jgi:MoaA/NifB/PqqE/SkfB family radical SAM enzyme|tara:strand:- start:1260 stop:2363 length:1104 start_codon:yes stop_codon:yes gene_type:complete